MTFGKYDFLFILLNSNEEGFKSFLFSINLDYDLPQVY